MFRLPQRGKIITSKSIFFVKGIALLFSSSILHAEDLRRPNIIWIIAEDMSPDLGCYGNQVVTTPNIDGLAEKGMQFTHVFTKQNSPCHWPDSPCLAKLKILGTTGKIFCPEVIVVNRGPLRVDSGKLFPFYDSIRGFGSHKFI